MKFSLPLTLLASLAAVTTAYAQGVVITAPSAGSNVHAGANITVEIDRPNSLTPSTEVSVAIGLMACGSGICPPPADVMGTILFQGPYTPQLVGGHLTQNFTVAIPSSFSIGPAQLNVAHFALVGAGPFPFLQTLNITLEVA
ncbi:hypothetical protein C8R46DRAFT_964200 [Mycena filopes]|nr:hypothetical protein C8R46DRAFT_964200 [Mycena filopes]